MGLTATRAALLDAIALSIVARQGMTNRDRARAVLDVIEAEGWTLTAPPHRRPTMTTINPTELEVFTRNGIKAATALCHGASAAAGWWSDIATGSRKERNVGEMLCLIHSEISEAMEAHRKTLMDDKLPHRLGVEVELADALIRIFDFAGGFNLDLAGALVEKLAYNAQREDHKIEARKAAGGKAY